MKRLILIALVSLFPLLGRGQTTLSAGDLVILAVNGDNDAGNSYGKGFSFMPLVNLQAGTEIYFTDTGWNDVNGVFIANVAISDSFIKYTAPAPVSAGTVIRNDSYTNTGFTYFFSYAGAASTNNYLIGLGGLSQSDEVLVFQGSIASPRFIFAVTYVSTNITPTGWAVNIGTNGTDGQGTGSALPGSGNASVTDLVDNVTALAFKCGASTNDNSAYVGATTPATKAEWLARVDTLANWVHNDAAPIPTPPTGPFVVSGASVPPSIVTTAATSIATTSATLGGQVTADGGATVTDRGVVYAQSSVNTNPLIGGTGVTKVQIGSGTGVYSQAVGSLAQGTSYRFNAYAINSAGTNYGVVGSFTTLAEADVSIASSHGTTIPVSGVYTMLVGTVFTNQVHTPVTQGTTQYVCSGWTMIGNEPAGGSGTQMVMTVTNDAVLTWLWTTNYWLEATAGDHGVVVGGGGWVGVGVTTQLSALADSCYHFTNWSGGASGNSNPLNVLMDGAKSVTANFATNWTTNKPTPEWWLAEHGITNQFEDAVMSDADGDGIPSGDEYVMNTDPTNGLSFLRVVDIGLGEGGETLRWPCATDRVYDVEFDTTFPLGGWVPVPGLTNLGCAEGWLILTNTLSPEALKMYRLRVRLPGE